MHQLGSAVFQGELFRPLSYYFLRIGPLRRFNNKAAKMKGSSTDSRPLKTRLREKQQYCRRTAVQAKDYFKLEINLM